jgi:hypothetical protein
MDAPNSTNIFAPFHTSGRRDRFTSTRVDCYQGEYGTSAASAHAWFASAVGTKRGNDLERKSVLEIEQGVKSSRHRQNVADRFVVESC